MRIDRRNFFKKALGAGAVAAAFSAMNFTSWASGQEDGQVVVKPSMCNSCSSHCGMWIHTKNDRPWKVVGHEDHGRSRGKLCARAHGGLHWVYDPDRIKTPLKKTANGQFEEISWDQATTEIAEKLGSILKKHGPETVFYGHNPRRTGEVYGNRFMHAIGVNTIMTHNASCNTARILGMNATFGRSYDADFSNTKYIMFIGRNPVEGIRTNTASAVMSAIEKGAKVVVVDPRHNATAAVADEWVPIRPGTDMAFLLAMAHVMVNENLYDKEFIENYCEGFEEFKAILPEYTPEWAEEITTISADTIVRLARELAANKPNCAIDTGWKGAYGANYENSTDTTRTVAYVNALLGNLNQTGGIAVTKGASLGSVPGPSPEVPKGPRADGVGTVYPLAPSNGLPHYVAERAAKGEVKAGFIRHHNPVRNFPDYDHMKKGFENLELLVVFETHMSETAIVADYILPEPSFAEREEVIEAIGRTVTMRTKAVPKIHPETKSFDEIITMLAEKCGVGEYFNFTLDELNEELLSTQDFDLAELKQKGSITVTVDQPQGVPELSTPSKKFEFYSQNFADKGAPPVAKWVAPITGYKTSNNNEFRLTHGKQGYHSHTATANIPQLAQITKDYMSNRIWINKQKADELGINDGDMLIIKSNGKTGQARAKVTERIHPEALFMPAGYGNKTPYYKVSQEIDALNPMDLVPYRLESISGHSMLQEVFVTVEKA